MAAAGLGTIGQAPGQPPGTEMTSISFRDQLWLNTYPLDLNLVFDYFTLSPFYDRTCNNEQLRIRSIHPLDSSQLSAHFKSVMEPNVTSTSLGKTHFVKCIGEAIMPGRNLAWSRKMTGIEYILIEAQEPHLFVIRKQKRDSPEKVTLMAAYYVLDGSIYQAPTLHGVIGSRVVRSLYHISKAFSQVATKLEKTGHVLTMGFRSVFVVQRIPHTHRQRELDTDMNLKVKSEEAGSDESMKKSADKAVDVKEIIRIDKILSGILRKLPPTPPPPPFVTMSTAPEGHQAQASQQTAVLAPAGVAVEQGPPLKRVKVEQQ